MGKKKPKNNVVTEALKSEVADFASSLGLASTVPSSGFNDTDFRKPENPRNPNSDNKFNAKFDKSREKSGGKFDKSKANSEKFGAPKPKIHEYLSVENTRASHDKFKNLPKLPLVKPSGLGVWHVDAAEIEERVIGGKRSKVVVGNVEERKQLVAKKRELAERLLAQYVREYEEGRGQSGDIKMIVATQRSGTAADKVSAFSVLIGDNPIANIKSLDALLGMVTSKVGKRHALSGFDTLREMFISSLLPDRKLKTLLQQPLDQLPENKDGYSLLLFWYWEECLKQRYEQFIYALEEASRDNLAILKDKAVKSLYVLLKSKSEQERRLLSALVNKLGDPENKVASNADFHLSKLLSDHPNMKAVVIDEVDNFLFRPHLGLRSKYYAVNFLTQIRLSHRGNGPNIAKRLIDVYFALFKVVISEADGVKANKKNKENHGGTSNDKDAKGPPESHVEMDSRLLTALLTGVNRAFPFVSSNEADDIVEVQTPMLFKLVHSNNFNVGIQALMLLDKISSKNQIVSDRFYRALYSKLLLPAAMHSSKEEMFIGLLLRAIKNDVNMRRVSAFAKRLLQVALQQPSQYACGFLFLLSEVLKAKPPLWNSVSCQNESDDEELEHFEDIVEESESQASIKANESDNVGEVRKNNEDTQNNDEIDTEDDSSVEEGGSLTSSSRDEFPEGDEDLDLIGGLNDQKLDMTSTSKSKEEVSSLKSVLLPRGYDPRHREPSYCKADHVSCWELTVLASHVHPSVATMAKTLLSGAHIVYNGNPLNDLSLSAFLDKFMEKQPKKTAWHGGGSEIEPAKQLDMKKQTIGAEILKLAEEDVPPEDLVFHKFYMNKMNTPKKTKKKKKKKVEEEEDAEDFVGDGGDDESDNDEIEAILDSTVPSDEDGEYDYDDLDKFANDDDDLVGNESDEDIEFPMDMPEDDVASIDSGSNGGDDVDLNVGDAEDESAEEETVGDKKRKRKLKAVRKGSSPFARLEDYEHLLNEENDPEGQTPKKGKRPKSKKKRKISK